MGSSTKVHRKCWNCNQPATHTLTREGSNTLHACDNCTRIDRTEAESRGWTITPISPTADKESQMAQDETPEQIAKRLGRSLEWAREHRGVHRCVDGKIYRVSCLVTDPTCDRVARCYMAITEAEANR